MKINKLFYVCLLAVGLIFTGCHNKKSPQGDTMTIKNGSTVSIDYTLKVDGKVVDTSEGKEPLVYVQGQSQIIPGLESKLEGLKKGDKKTVVVAPEDGYGTIDQNALQKVPKSSFNEADKMKVGDVVNGKVKDQEFHAMVSSIDKDEITLDFNHPLAGKTLNFDVTVMDVK